MQGICDIPVDDANVDHRYPNQADLASIISETQHQDATWVVFGAEDILEAKCAFQAMPNRFCLLDLKSFSTSTFYLGNGDALSTLIIKTAFPRFNVRVLV